MNDIPSASQMWRHANCSGNRILIRSLRDRGILIEERASEDATIGQRIHAALEGDEVLLSYSEQDIKDDCDRLAYQCASRFHVPGESWGILQREVRYDYWIDTPEPVFFTGKPDYVQFFDGNRRILDINYKTGRKESIDSHLNLQLRTEAVLLWRHYKPNQIGAAIVEPLVSNKPEIVVYDQKDLQRAEIEILSIVDRTDNDPRRVAGPWCEHCPARVFCPEAKAHALAEPLYIYTPPTLPSGADAAIFIERLYTARKLIGDYLDHYEDLVRERFNAVPGWHISEGKEVRSIDAGAALLAAPQAKDLVKQTLPIGKLEDLMRKEWGISGKEFEQKFAATFRDAIHVKKTEGSLRKIPKRLLKP